MKEAPILKVVDLHKWFGEVHALDGMDFEICPGEVVGILGDNGAGKSTLVKIITGVIPKSKGKILFEGKEIRTCSIQSAKRLGIETVYQEQAIIGTRTVAQNVFLGREPTKTWLGILDKPKMNNETKRLMADLKLGIQSHEQEARFCSGGERQGIAVSRAMYFKAKLVILDEPTTALSIGGVKRIQEFVVQLKMSGIACIIISHNLYHVYPVADRFVIMSRGGKKAIEIRKETTSVEKLEDLIANL